MSTARDNKKNKNSKNPRVEFSKYYLLQVGIKARPENQGSVYVNDYTHKDVWIGRIEKSTGKFTKGNGYEYLDDEMKLHLMQVALDPAAAAASHGKSTGECCFCKRDLSDSRSLTVGYGPICAKNFGLPWGSSIE